ncbi:MAG: sulfite exporter TauE/SafE family protein [Burkholderiales bacterium]|nr:MAG: sulfite exporter TauE/SafE family protein [Burkholderiales bacterium]
MELQLGELAPPVLLVAMAAALVGFTAFGLVGFGSTGFFVPILVHFVPLKTAVPAALLLDLVATQLLRTRNLAEADRGELRILLPFVLIGAAIGLTALVRMPREAALLALSLFVLFYGGWLLVNPRIRAAIPRPWAIPFGTAGGFFAALFGFGGPMYSIYYARRIADKTVLRATITTTLMVNVLMRGAVMLFAGLLLEPAVLFLAAAGLPSMWIGLRLGRRLHERLNDDQARRVIGLLLLVSGAALLARA